jgi:oxygen-independent coproporphyrinogen-3 oxidase
LVSPEKILLASKTMHREEKILAQNSPQDFSLYLSVPFCPTRCAYCSFVSSSVEKTMKLIPQYVELLCKEIEAAAKQAEKLNLHLVSVYMGGGTPTTLTAQQLDQVLSCVKRSFDFSLCREYTVEAGRPDTITSEKLAVLKKWGTDRISINPQTLNDRVLEVIGRRHTAKQTREAFLMARKAGFENINMDLIVGLPGESVESFYDTLNTLLEWAPESITVHDLALKRSSRLYQEGKIQEDAAAACVMLDYADRILPENGYTPYYLYRQSRMVGNLENVGFAKPGFESPYNVFIMDESQHILGCGAGAVTKLCVPQKSGQRIRRIFNFKYPFEYISRHEEILERKKQVSELS